MRTSDAFAVSEDDSATTDSLLSGAGEPVRRERISQGVVRRVDLGSVAEFRELSLEPAFTARDDRAVARKYFGSLLVGYHSPEGFRLAGRVGTGFSEKLLASVDAQLQKLKQPACPFINLLEKTKGRWGQGITPEVMNRCQWVKPVLVAQVKFTEWTLDDQLRQPVFLGLRTDKDPKDVVRE